MKLAWFRAHDTRAHLPLDPTAALIAALSSEHQIDVITEPAAHDFVWMHFRRPYDLCIFELEDTEAHAFIWPYVMEFGGLSVLHSLTFDAQHARLRYRSSPDVGARIIAVPYPGSVDAVQDQYSDAVVRYAPMAVARIEHTSRPATSAITFGALATDSLDIVATGIEAARGYGADARMLTASSPPQLIAEADVVVSLRGAATAESARLGMTAMASGRPVLALETAITADWPALDPQSWTPRPPALTPAAAVTVDPRDEANSVANAITRLARDRVLREQLSRAGRAWGRTRAGLDAAIETWRALLTEAVRLPAPARRQEWADHPDGTGDARRILEEFGVSIDLF